MNCTNCGENLAPGTVSCPKCGTPVAGAQVVQPVVSGPTQPVVPSPAPAIVVAPTPAPVPSPAPVTQPTVAPAVMPAGMPQPSPVPVQQQPAPQPAVVGTPVQPVNNGGSKKGLVIGIIVVLLLAVLGLGGYFIYDKIQENKAREEAKELLEEIEKEEKEYKETQEDLKTKISVKEVKKLNNGSLLITVKNETTKTVGVDVEIEYYDASNNILGSEKEYIDLAPESERYLFVGEYSVKEGYETVKTNVSAMDYSDIVRIEKINETDLTKNETTDELILQYNNKTEYEMGVEVLCFFYLKDELVYVLEDFEHFIAAGNNANLNLYLDDVEDIQYDRYELVSYAEYDIYND